MVSHGPGDLTLEKQVHPIRKEMVSTYLGSATMQPCVLSKPRL